MSNHTSFNLLAPRNSMHPFISPTETLKKTLNVCIKLKKAPGHHSYTAMRVAGLEYTDNGDTAQCHSCGLEVLDLAPDMKPFDVHKQRRPTCPFVVSMLQSSITNILARNSPCSVPSPSVNDEKASKELKTHPPYSISLVHALIEVESLKQIRKRTFSHWPYQSSPSAAQMIQAGFFYCNIGDRVICIYCNLICHLWAPDSDDPCEIHKALSPKCPFVTGILAVPRTTSTVDEQTKSLISNSQRICIDSDKKPCHSEYSEAEKRSASFNTWCSDYLPSVDDMVQAGFFYTGIKNKVTCFYCNGSLQNWGANDNPMIEHVRWFPQCTFAKQLCGAELYRKIQESQRARQKVLNTNDSRSAGKMGYSNPIDNCLLKPDDVTLSRLVATRLHLPIIKSMLDRNFKLNIIKKCWEDQFRLKYDDFASDSDLLMAYNIIQKQIEHINGNKENIIVPSVAMREIRDRKRTALENALHFIPRYKIQLTNPCILCSEKERCLACIPCGHLMMCVPCGQLCRSCPRCNTKIDAFVRIYR